MTWYPEISYELDDNGVSARFPFIHVPDGEEMPKLLYILESRETEESEISPDGDQLPIFQLDMHQYADMAVLKSSLSPAAFDAVRSALGLEPLEQAMQKGEKIMKQSEKTAADG